MKMIVSAKGRSYQPGKALSAEIRRLIIDEIVKEGGVMFLLGISPARLIKLLASFTSAEQQCKRYGHRTSKRAVQRLDGKTRIIHRIFKSKI